MILPINTVRCCWTPGTYLVFIHSFIHSTWAYHHGKHGLQSSPSKSPYHQKKSPTCTHQPLPNVFQSCNFLSCQPRNRNKRMQKRTMTTKSDLQSNKLPAIGGRQRSFNFWYSCWEYKSWPGFLRSLFVSPTLISSLISRHESLLISVVHWDTEIFTTLVLLKKNNDDKLSLSLTGFKTQAYYLIFRGF